MSCLYRYWNLRWKKLTTWWPDHTHHISCHNSQKKLQRTNGPWNWRLTIPKTIKMTLVRPLMTDFKMTVRADYAVSAWSPLPLSIKALAPWLSEQGVTFRQESALPQLPLVAGIQNKANFPFHQPDFFIGCWVVNCWFPLSAASCLNIFSLSRRGMNYPG